MLPIYYFDSDQPLITFPHHSIQDNINIKVEVEDVYPELFGTHGEQQIDLAYETDNNSFKFEVHADDVMEEDQEQPCLLANNVSST